MAQRQTWRTAHLRTLLLVATASASTTALAASPAFIEATSERDGGKPQSSMWNAVDGNPGTVWCSSAPPGRKEALNFTFEEPVVITHLGIVTATKDGAPDKTVKRARIVYVADVDHRVEAKFKDVPEGQQLELTPPAKGKRIVIEFEEPYLAEGSDNGALCVAEITLKAKGKDLTDGLGQKARGVNTPARKLLHQWHDDISAPMRTLIFNVDGTFSYTYVPLLDDAKPAKVKGRWAATAGSVTLETGGKSYKLNTRLSAVDTGEGASSVLTLEGTAPHQSMTGDFNPAPLLLP